MEGTRTSALMAAQAAAGGPAWAPPSPFSVDEQALFVVDGVTLPEEPERMVREGKAHAVDIMAGSNSDEGTLFVLDYYNGSMPTALFRQKLNASLYVDGHGPRGSQGELLERLLQLYPPSSGDDAGNLQLLAAAGSDMQFVCSMRRLVRDASNARRQREQPALRRRAERHGGGGAGVAAAAAARGRRPATFLYHYAHRFPETRAACADSYFDAAWGVTHTAELSYVFGAPLHLFGAPPPGVACAFTDAEQAFADGMGAAWAAFARTGSPVVHSAAAATAGGGGGGGGAGGGEWPEYVQATDLDAVLEQGAGRGVESGRRAKECDAWDLY